MVNQKLSPEAKLQLRKEQATALDSYIKEHKVRSFCDLAIARDKSRQQLLEAMADILAPLRKSPHKWQPMNVCQTLVPGPAAVVALPVIIVQTNPKRSPQRKG